MKNIFVYGSLNVDYTLALPKRIRRGETLKATKLVKSCGGKGANQAYAAAKLGAHVYMLGDVGKDSEGRLILKKLNEICVNTEGVMVHDDASTGLAMITLFDQNNEIIIYPGANAKAHHRRIKQVLDRYAHQGDYFVIQFEKNHEDIETAVHFAKLKGLTIVCNPSPMDVDLLMKIRHVIDLVIVNETEYEDITKKTFDHIHCLENLSELQLIGFKDIIITCGKDGSVGYVDGYSYFNQAMKVDVLDTTGAGDTFLGAFLCGVSQGLNDQDALLLATKAAGIAVTRYGAQESMPSLEEIK